MPTETAVPNRDEIVRTYDEHEVRMATYLGRDLDDGERRNMAIEGLIEHSLYYGIKIAEFEEASDRADRELDKGETVGRAIVAGLELVNGEGQSDV